MSMGLFWIIVAGFFFIAEIATVGFLLFWLGIGAILALIVSIFTESIIIQTTVFAISSIVLILSTKPLVNKFTKKDKTISTNVYSVIGKKGIVLEEINSKLRTGTIKVDGETWTAISTENLIIPVNSEIEIIDIKGVKALVKPLTLTEKV